MAAAVAKAQEKNRVPESPQDCDSSFHRDAERETAPLSLPKGTDLHPESEPHVILTRLSGGRMTNKTKPKYRTISKSSKPFQTTCLG